MRVGFIGLGNVGGKLAGSLLRNGVGLTVRDLDDALVEAFVDQGAERGESPVEMMKDLRRGDHLPAVASGIGSGHGK